MILFGDYSLPVFYHHRSSMLEKLCFAKQGSVDCLIPDNAKGIQFEHHFTRTNCGLFDVSHMGRIRIHGNDSFSFVDFILPSDVDHLSFDSIDQNSSLSIGGGRYTVILDDQAHIIDDVVIYRIAKDDYYLCCNSVNRKKLFDWLKTVYDRDFFSKNIYIDDLSSVSSQIAIQGPKSTLVLNTIFNDQNIDDCLLNLDMENIISKLKYMRCVVCGDLENPVIIARSGYTGEIGFELYFPNSSKLCYALWPRLFDQDENIGVLPIGLGARNTLRLEAGFLLHGVDIDHHSNIFLASLGWLRSKSVKQYIGKNACDRYANHYSQLSKLSSKINKVCQKKSDHCLQSKIDKQDDKQEVIYSYTNWMAHNDQTFRISGFEVCADGIIIRDNTKLYGFVYQFDNLHSHHYPSLNIDLCNNCDDLDPGKKNNSDKVIAQFNDLVKRAQSFMVKPRAFEFICVGKVTSGSFLPTVKKSGGMVRISKLGLVDELLWCYLRRRWVSVKICDSKFYPSRAFDDLS